ncbi:MAG: HEAT repeat domain-containing protein [Planctomycetota bacterium]
MRIVTLVVLSSLAVVASCANPRDKVTGTYIDLHSPDELVLINATIRVGELGDLNAVPHLIANLRHEDGSVRLQTHMALLKVLRTQGNPHKFLAYDSPGVREQAVRAWEKWYEETGRQDIQNTLEARKAKTAAGDPPTTKQ